MILFALGAACMVASIGSAVVIAKGGGGDARKDKLHVCFDRAKLYIRQRIEEKWVFTYPTVDGQEEFKEYKEYTFTLPIGVDPDRVFKSYWVFKQGFGEHIDIIGDTATFKLKVYNKGLEQFDYNVLDVPTAGIRLPIIVGRSREGWEVYDMVENPHLLIAGETGSGKSTHIRALLTTLIHTKSPDELQLYLADMKRSEFHLFRNVPHVVEVVTETERLIEVLKELDIEMKHRGNLCDQYEVSHVDDLPFKMPYIIVCVDEVALLKKEKEIMRILEDITAIGRALSTFAILSLQRPDAEVLNGKLKQNLTVRMAFKHADGINSRITLGCEGAEDIKASESGLMLYKRDGIKRVQSPYLSLVEAKKLLKG
ncbi:S-DNA-T family DNA segregation ATPase FtsK/SpoIIIE [Paenibacillus sp. V4I3]|nr:S-DNA-T family DNA segregation ATPase FtsK/SpoIIIE [Paenibacillus sp. V4I3]